MLSSTVTDCSEAQIIPLSNVLEWMMELTAILISAESSMITGVLPGPTPSAGFPEEYADLTIPGPPVARISSESLITVVVSSNDGTSIHPMIPSGAPAFAAAIVHAFAAGCGLMMIAFLVFKQINVLKIAVDVGFVVGITAATRPTGSAIFLIPYALSSSITPHVLSFLYLL